MKPTRAITFTTSAALLALATGLYAPLGRGQSYAPSASVMHPNPTHETVRAGVSDTSITTKVKANLLDQKKLSSMHIHVRTRDGVVRLTGSVPTATERRMATEVAKGVTGVTSVENHLGLHKS
ncbi:Osmotically-inducible protein Y [Ralstonia psammae]|uniref:Osmotically-inducible protein Y n=1 Tax=Ralstonia psammae TaxID=3058598 RepID=A0ABN9IUY9_9RALS|nr:BON domain-containing protein [Ralstonia sp. LMG 19083]CAJ0791615.1 Osmotically-inducible protein Y [Ralstonia sp. LMG 19083]